ncbi:MAG: FtsX-like permease family protein [Candidatus Marinimicrobia bacterium]|jgi:putative ABC transport system permease protein|nr:FtsX-like permease family protein [Candidatus Neomarinimicrobiota bacterium]MBT3632859.1 FtsX-like permease family protein [Candidatus Neomarinimicrobiota bacterium]MBT3681969.1 FtsX-like permease family protein [Candidatus Neomarinimicrobiota bacterium]MBT3759002.1 FtsX-like permease family protein [Candidatus Neomarinimicrobiota bacterium]MBT3895099.1 FtsX-like permease family protein [Candidatus Neomarinimicrobiota bacterium]
MLKNYLVISLRNMRKQKGYSFINIFGLAIGIMSCLFILMYILYETNFDSHFQNSDRIVRVTVKGALGGNEFQMALSTAPLAKTLLAEYPEVEQATRMRGNFGFPVFRYKNAVFSEEHWSAADSTFFDIFNVNFVRGDASTALNRPDVIILTETTAKRYFGTENPIGKLLNMDNRKDWEVSAVIEDFPPNTHFKYDMLSSLLSYPEMSNNEMWVSNNFYTYARLKKGTNLTEFEDKLAGLVTKFVGPNVEQMMGVSFDQLQEQGANYQYKVQPLRDIHLYSHLDNEHRTNGNPATIYVFMMIAIFILVIACINYMNLATAKYTNRTKEVGIRKTLGSSRKQLISQFLTESILLSIFAVVFAVLLVELLIPGFNSLTGLSLNLSSTLITIAFFAALVVGIFAGSYPAFVLSSYDPTKVFRSGASVNGKGSWLRNGLVIFQFTVSIILFIAAMVVSDQLEFMMNKDLGLNPDQVLVIKKTDDIGAHIDSFKEALRQNPNILTVSNSTSIPGDIQSMMGNVMRVSNQEEENMQLVNNFLVDQDFSETYEIEMAEGRFFSNKYATDSLAVVLNESAVRIYNFDDPLSEQFDNSFGPNQDVKFNVIGVMKDFHFESLSKDIGPLVIYSFNQNMRFGKFVSLKLKSENISSTLKFIEKTWKEFALDQAFEYELFDDHFAAQYQAEVMTKKLVTRFTVLAMFIACLGLFGLASYSAERRTKEIGIRKVLGASVRGITARLSLEFTKWIIISNLIAFPLAWFMLRKWLEIFAYRVDLSLLTFLSAGFAALIIAMATVGFQAFKAANSNPIKSLRFE